jgi:antitoxin component YwqK of YwqJK toxin-antitoxin module
MHVKLLIFSLFFVFPVMLFSQEVKAPNQTDKAGKKQGHWIKKYPDGNIMYDGFFHNDKPTGEFKRYYEDGHLKSKLVFSADGTSADASLYYENGFIASRGKYVNQLKEGKWKFYSVSNQGIPISDEEYLNNKRNGISHKFYPDSTVAEIINYRNDIKNGEWIKYYPDGSVTFRANYTNGKLNGNFVAFFEDGKTEVVGKYKNGLRDSIWIINNKDGSQRFRIEYVDGMARNHDMDIYESNYLDSLEKNRIEIPDPDKTGKIW